MLYLAGPLDDSEATLSNKRFYFLTLMSENMLLFWPRIETQPSVFCLAYTFLHQAYTRNDQTTARCYSSDPIVMWIIVEWIYAYCNTCQMKSIHPKTALDLMKNWKEILDSQQPLFIHIFATQGLGTDGTAWYLWPLNEGNQSMDRQHCNFLILTSIFFYTKVNGQRLGN